MAPEEPISAIRNHPSAIRNHPSAIRASAPPAHFNNRGDVIARSGFDGIPTYLAGYEAFMTRRSILSAEDMAKAVGQHGTTTTSTEWGTNPDRQQANTKEEDPTASAGSGQAGLLNEGYRYRDLQTGTFISRDPLGFVDGPNLYAYVVQNPWTKFDPLGLKTIDDYERENRRHQRIIDSHDRFMVDLVAGGATVGEARTKARERSNEAKAAIKRNNQALNQITESARWANEKFGEDLIDPYELNDESDFYSDLRWAKHTGQALDFAVEEGVTTLLFGPLKWAGKLVGKAGSRVRSWTKGISANYVPAPGVPSAFPDLRRVRGKSQVQGGGKLRRRWEDSDGNIYEWDHRHGTVEMYNKGGRHMGEFDAETGEMINGPKKDRRTPT